MSTKRSILLFSLVLLTLYSGLNVAAASVIHTASGKSIMKKAGIVSQKYSEYTPVKAGHLYSDNIVTIDIDDIQPDTHNLTCDSDDTKYDKDYCENNLILIRKCSLTFSESGKFFLFNYFPRI